MCAQATQSTQAPQAMPQPPTLLPTLLPALQPTLPPSLCLMLTPPGVMRAFVSAQPTELERCLQTLLPAGAAWTQADWLRAHPEQAALLEQALAQGWAQTVVRRPHPPQLRLDDFLPHVIAGLSGQRQVALASDTGFCLARVGYGKEEAEHLCVAAADWFVFQARQRRRGWLDPGHAVAFHHDSELLLPTTTLLGLWVDGVGYALVLGGEPLVNNLALVELVWGLRQAGRRFELPFALAPNASPED
jgi:hypothetical protein